MWLLIAVLSALLFGMSGLLMKVSQMQRGSLSHLLFGLFLSGSIGFGIHAFWTSSTDWLDWKLWIGGLLVGMGAAWGNLIFMKVLEYGPASLSSPLMNMNIVVVILLSVWVYHESIQWNEWAGISFLLGAVVLISIRKEPWTVTEKKWFLLIGAAILLFTFRNGGLKVTSEQLLNNTQVLFIAYILSTVWFFFSAFLSKRHPNAKSASDHAPRIGLLWGLACGVFSYGGLQLYAVALDQGKASIIAPIFATNSLVIALGSIFIYKERLSQKQLLALVFMFCGLIVIKL
ncbi:DMT family transporter [Cohnella sp.]|uniref:DMT family transporter n=1 Tax=Cohnella sp. TaxID=1883426 RepID=UPI0035671C29